MCHYSYSLQAKYGSQNQTFQFSLISNAFQNNTPYFFNEQWILIKKSSLVKKIVYLIYFYEIGPRGDKQKFGDRFIARMMKIYDLEPHTGTNYKNSIRQITR